MTASDSRQDAREQRRERQQAPPADLAAALLAPGQAGLWIHGRSIASASSRRPGYKIESHLLLGFARCHGGSRASRLRRPARWAS